jgi:predicted nucleotidyltransferase
LKPPNLEASLFGIIVLYLIMQELEKYKLLILPVLKRYFIKRAAIFGSIVSAATIYATVKSDLPVLKEQLLVVKL